MCVSYPSTVGSEKEFDLMQPRRDLLKFLKPGLDAALADRAGALLDAVSAHLESLGPTRLLDAPPPLTFDPVVAGSYVADPKPIPRPALPNGLADAQVSDALRETPEWMDPADLANLLADGTLDRHDVLERFADRIRQWDPVLNCFARVTLDPESTPSRGGVLGGVPIGIQDMIGTAGVLTTAGSHVVSSVGGGCGSRWQALHARVRGGHNW